jgi:hypothetical protein
MTTFKIPKGKPESVRSEKYRQGSGQKKNDKGA